MSEFETKVIEILFMIAIGVWFLVALAVITYWQVSAENIRNWIKRCIIRWRMYRLKPGETYRSKHGGEYLD